MSELQRSGFIAELAKKGKKEVLAVAAVLGIGSVAAVEDAKHLAKIDLASVAAPLVEELAIAGGEAAARQKNIVEGVKRVIPDDILEHPVVKGVMQSQTELLDKVIKLAEKVEKDGLDTQP